MQKKHGTFGWNELMTTDVGAAKEFYGKTIGWQFRDVSMGAPSQPAREGEPSYTLWTIGDMEVGGAMKLEGPGMDNVPPHWLSYVNVDDADDVARKVRDNGGRIIAGPLDIEGIGRFYVIADPQGAVLGIGTSTMQQDS